MYRRCTILFRRILIGVPDYSSIFLFFSKNEEGANPPGGKKYLGTPGGKKYLGKNMYRRCTILFRRILIGVPDYSSIFLFFFKK